MSIHLRSASRWMVAGPVVQFAVIGVAALVIVGVATQTASGRVGQREAITDARTATLIEAEGLVEPAVLDNLVYGDPVARGRVGRVVDSRLLSSSLVRVKIWNSTGEIVYSDDPSLEGARFELGSDERNALVTGAIEADISDLSDPENRDERSFGKLIEVYLPIRSPNGTRLLFEVYYRYAPVAAAGRRIWRSFAPVSLGALLALELLQIPVAWSLARRLRLRQLERESLLQRTLDASDVERRRIASDLHDGVVQDLAGVAFALAGAARVKSGPVRSKSVLEDAAASVRASIGALRTTLVDIYPPDLTRGDLGMALQDLASGVASDDLRIVVDVEHLDDPTPKRASAVVYRVAREALRNVAAHSRATEASVRAGRRRSGKSGSVVWVEISDNGVGFDKEILEIRAAEGHFGLKGVEGVVQDAAGMLLVESAGGRGTTIRAEVPDA